MKTKKVLVTGGEGFVGYHLCKRLNTLGYVVTSLDLNLSGRNDRRIEGVNYITGDTKDINTIFSEEKFELIFHLGEYSRLENSFENIDKVVQSNIIGTSEVLEFWRKQKSKLIYAGSSTKFSIGLTAQDMSPYSYTKAANTELVEAYAKWFGLEYAITYFYNVYGDKENSEGMLASVVAIFLKRSKLNLPLQIVLPGTQKRNFTHVDDIVDGVILVAEKATGDEYGIGSEDLFSINELASMIGGDVEFLPERRGNRNLSDLMTTKIKDLGWNQKRNLTEYIMENK